MAAPIGSIRSESIRFRESDTAIAGTFTGTFEVPGGAILVDVIVHGVALWNSAGACTLNVGDSVTTNGFYSAVNLKATDLLAGESLSFGLPGGLYGADIAPNDASAATLILGQAGHVKRRALVSQAARNLQATVSVAGAVSGPTGITDVIFVYAYPSPIKPTFV